MKLKMDLILSQLIILFQKRPVETYTYTGGLLSNQDNDENDFRIVRLTYFFKRSKC